jgi:hypothetical protein
VKYAAKRTWPDKPKSWEAKGEAETAEAFALDFAADKGLGLGTELVVMEMDGDDAEIQFFKVANTSPYQMRQAEPRATGTAASREESPGETSPTDAVAESQDAAAAALPDLRPFKTMVLYMIKVALVAFAAIYAFGLLFRYLRSVL